MGNCWGTQVKVFQSRSSIRPSSSTPGTSKNNSNEGLQGVSSSSSCTEEVFPDGQILPTPNLRVFNFADLKAATRNFRSDVVLGEGGFGKVYKGWIDWKTHGHVKSGDGKVIAVKKLNSESLQGLQEWQSEVNFLGRLSHPNLVRLLGYCWEDTELLLVYEYMPKGSLENHLFRRSAAFKPLSWSVRLKIALGAARGLAFLHTSEKQVIYRDFKASNILLDLNYNAKISDFGLAKNGPGVGESHVTTRVMGTYGYAAPEYVATGHLYVKSDVYGYGVVLLEMLSGKRALDTSRPDGQHNLVDYARPCLSERSKLARLMDPRLEGRYPSKGAMQAGQLALKCLSSDPRSRPSMKEVVQTLEQIQAIKDRPMECMTRSPTPSPHHPHYNAHKHHSHNRSPLRPMLRGTDGRALAYQLPSPRLI